MLRRNKLSFKRSLVKFATVLSVFFTGISFINVPLQTQTVQAASQSKTEKRNAVVQLAKDKLVRVTFMGLLVLQPLTAQA